MVATRRSLGGGGGSSPTPSPSADTAPLTKAQRAQLKKLDISGTDALKGDDLKAVQAARENLPTYHWRGASYLQDENTDAAWVDNQPERYLKRSREAGPDDGDGVEGRTAPALEEEEEDEEENEQEDEDEENEEEEDEDEEAPPPLKRPKLEQDHELEPYMEAIRKSHADRLDARAARDEGHQKPSEKAAAAVATSSPTPAKKATTITEDTGDNTMNTKRSDDVESGRGKKRTRKHSASDDDETEQPTKRRTSQNESKARSVPSSADLDKIDKDKKRSKKKAARMNLKTKPLREEDMYSEGEQRRQKVVQLAKVQKQLRQSTEDWHFAKEQLEKAKAHNAAQRAAQQAGIQNVQQPIDLSQDAAEHENRDEDMVDEQLEREQQQSRSASQGQLDYGSKAVDTPLEEVNDAVDSEVNVTTEAEQDRYTPTVTTEQHQETADKNMAAPLEASAYTTGKIDPPKQSTSGAFRTSPPETRPETPTTLADAATAFSHPTITSTQPNHTPTAAITPLDTPSSNSSVNSSNDSKTSTTSAERNAFASLPPGAELPTTSAGGDPLRWSIQQRLSAETGRDQYALDMGRLQGETKQARRRRIARERAVVGSWAKMTGADIVELRAAGNED